MRWCESATRKSGGFPVPRARSSVLVATAALVVPVPRGAMILKADLLVRDVVVEGVNVLPEPALVSGRLAAERTAAVFVVRGTGGGVLGGLRVHAAALLG